jgi:LuxR family maltose regulon positive regulatory protein
LGYAYELQGNRAAAGRAYAEALAAAQTMGHMIMAMMSTLGVANMQEADNQLHLAAQTFQGLLQWIGDPPPPPICEAYLGLARIHYEWNDLEAAHTFWEQNVPLAAQFGPKIDRIVLSDLFHARLKLVQGEVNEAAAVLAKAETAVHQHNFVQRLPAVTAMQVWVLLRQGDLTAAAHLAEKHDLPLSQARVYLAQGESEQALASLASACQQIEAKNWANELLKVTVLQALAYEANGDGETAVQHLSDALTLAQPHGFIRTFVDEGQPMMALLAKTKARPEQGRRDEGDRMKTYIQTLLDAFAMQDKIHPSSLLPSTSSGQALHPLEDPLSEREIEVLQLVAQGFSNREISEQLFLALDTVKGHNRRIFGKLQAQNRTEAAARARELGLV